MKEITKQKLRSVARRTASAFLLYGLLPLICLGLAAMILLLHSVTPAEATAALQAMGDRSVMAVAGEVFYEKLPEPNYYFLSDRLRLPYTASLMASFGFTPEKMPETEKSPVPEKRPEILYDALPAGAVPVVQSDLSSSSYYINTTKYQVDIEKARAEAFPSGTSTENGPLVLVLHTHGTESYFEDRTNLSDFAEAPVVSYFVEGETVFRTTDPEKSVVSVGAAFCEALEAQGIPTLHCTVMHDKEDFNDAYVLAAETAKQYLKQYPSIQYVIDLHRDAVVRGDSYVKSHAEVEGESVAQVMLVVGTNQNGRHPNWQQNLTVACAFKDKMDALYPSLSRSLYLRTARFNQEFLPGCMLLEVGSAANTLDEARAAARLAAQSLAAMIKEKAPE